MKFRVTRTYEVEIDNKAVPRIAYDLTQLLSEDPSDTVAYLYNPSNIALDMSYLIDGGDGLAIKGVTAYLEDETVEPLEG